MESLKWVSQESAASKHLHITHFLDPSTVELDNGQLACVIEFQGVGFETADSDILNQFKFLKHSVLARLTPSFGLYEYTLRRRLNIALDGTFPDDFTAAVDRAYQTKFEKKNFYENFLYLVLIYRGHADQPIFESKLNVFQRCSQERIKAMRAEYRDKAWDHLRRETRQIMAMLKVFEPRLVGEDDGSLGYSELMTFLGMLVNGLSKTHFAFPTLLPLCVGPGFKERTGIRPAAFSPMLKEDGKNTAETRDFFGTLPQGSVSHYLLTHRLFFGDVIEFRAADGCSKFGALLSIKAYPTETVSTMLDSLLQLDAEFLYTNSFLIEEDAAILRKIGRHRVKMSNAKDLARSQMAALSICQDQVASGAIKVGYHHHSLMVLADTREALKIVMNRAISCYSEASFGVIAESLGLEAAFWAQFPGNQAYIFRAALITSQNYVDFCPMHNYRTGYVHQNHLGSAVSLLETPAKTPLFFNFHAKGSGKKNDLTPGHTTIIGGNGSGKSVFMGFMDSQMSRYGGRSYFFDRDRGLEIYIRATGGIYWKLSPSHPEEACFNPFALEDTPMNRSFLKVWMKQLIRLENERELEPKVELMLSDCVDYAFESLRPEDRYLSKVCRILPLDFPAWDRLRQWCRQDGKYSDGQYSYLFDNAEDNFQFHRKAPSNIPFQASRMPVKIGFDFTELLSQPSSVLTAVCMYLMHQIKNSLDGSRVSIFFDEGWQILDSPYWQSRLKQDLPTFRKMNAHLVLATQSPASILNSALSAQFLDNSATHIFFCNPNANFEKHYRHFHVTPSEFHFLSKTPSELRWFLYKQGQDSSICKLNLSGMDAFLAVYSGNKQTLGCFDQVRAEVGDDPAEWLPLFCKKVLGKPFFEDFKNIKNIKNKKAGVI